MDEEELDMSNYRTFALKNTLVNIVASIPDYATTLYQALTTPRTILLNGVKTTVQFKELNPYAEEMMTLYGELVGLTSYVLLCDMAIFCLLWMLPQIAEKLGGERWRNIVSKVLVGFVIAMSLLSLSASTYAILVNLPLLCDTSLLLVFVSVYVSCVALFAASLRGLFTR